MVCVGGGGGKEGRMQSRGGVLTIKIQSNSRGRGKYFVQMSVIRPYAPTGAMRIDDDDEMSVIRRNL